MRRAAAQTKSNEADVKLRKRGSKLTPVQNQGTPAIHPMGTSLTLSPTLLAQPKADAQPKVAGRAKTTQPAPVPVQPKSRKQAKAETPATKPTKVEQAPEKQEQKVETTPARRQAPQMVASGRKRAMRGRKRIVLPEIEGWGIYNREASHLVRGFFARRTDAISHLEDQIQEPWSKIKHQGKFAPVRLTITINPDDLAAATVQ